ncbi:hypothetical protein BC628DRAFT_1502196 [Trametes gibbosa]|nr:hypothetical protein BC628DRAFT_1502196 [Trametes gibbosa]
MVAKASGARRTLGAEAKAIRKKLYCNISRFPSSKEKKAALDKIHQLPGTAWYGTHRHSSWCSGQEVKIRKESVSKMPLVYEFVKTQIAPTPDPPFSVLVKWAAMAEVNVAMIVEIMCDLLPTTSASPALLDIGFPANAGASQEGSASHKDTPLVLPLSEGAPAGSTRAPPEDWDHNIDMARDPAFESAPGILHGLWNTPGEASPGTAFSGFVAVADHPEPLRDHRAGPPPAYFNPADDYFDGEAPRAGPSRWHADTFDNQFGHGDAGNMPRAHDPRYASSHIVPEEMVHARYFDFDAGACN